jgi:tetratricopeptide (TPR) repeat protein
MSAIHEALKRAAKLAPPGRQLEAANAGPTRGDPFPEGLAAQPAPARPQPHHCAAAAPRSHPRAARGWTKLGRWGLVAVAVVALVAAYKWTASSVDTPKAEAQPCVYREKIVDERDRLMAEAPLPEEAVGPQTGSPQAKAPVESTKAPAPALKEKAKDNPKDQRGKAKDSKLASRKALKGTRLASAEDEGHEGEAPVRKGSGRAALKRPSRGPAAQPVPVRGTMPPPGPLASRSAALSPRGVKPYGPLPASQFGYSPPRATAVAAAPSGAAMLPAVRPQPAQASQAATSSDMTEELYRQALEKERQGKPAQAAALYALVLDKQPTREGASLRLGNLLFRQKNYDEAADVFRKAVAAHETATLHNNLGSVYLSQKKLDQARQEFSAAASLDPRYADPHYNLACYHALAGQHQQALSELEKAKVLNPKVLDWAAQDGDLAPVRALPEYKRLTE